MDAFDVTLQGVTDWLKAHGLEDLDFANVREVRFTPRGVEVDQFVVDQEGKFVRTASGDDIQQHTTARRYA